MGPRVKSWTEDGLAAGRRRQRQGPTDARQRLTATDVDQSDAAMRTGGDGEEATATGRRARLLGTESVDERVGALDV